MIYRGPTTCIQKKDHSFSPVVTNYKLTPITRAIHIVDDMYKPIGPTMLVEWEE